MSSTFFVNPRSNPELRSLYEIILLPQQRHLHEYFTDVMAVLSQHFSVGYSALMLRDSQKDSLSVEGLYGVPRDAHPLSYSIRKGAIGQALDSCRPFAIQALSQEPFYDEMTRGAKPIEKIRPPLLCIPLVAESESIGVINITSLYGPRDEFTEDFQFLSILSAVLAPVVKSHLRKGEEALQRSEKGKTRSAYLDELLNEKLAEVLNKIDPYVESNAKMNLFDDIIAVVERILIKTALERVDYVQVSAAQLLGINRNTLRKKIRDLKIKTPRHQSPL